MSIKCLLKSDILALKTAIREQGGMSALRKMSTQERIDFLAKSIDAVGSTENAQVANKAIEKALLNSQTLGAREWLDNLKKRQPKTPQDDKSILAIINNKNNKDIWKKADDFQALVEQKLGFRATGEQVKDLVIQANTINALMKKMTRVEPTYLTMTAKQVENMSDAGKAVRQEMKDKIIKFKETTDALKVENYKRQHQVENSKFMQAILNIASAVKSARASADISFLLRQNSGLLMIGDSNINKVWKDSSAKALALWKETFNTAEQAQAAYNEIIADIMTRPNALNGNYARFGLALGINEEAFPESFISNWNVFRESEKSFNAAAQLCRAGMFDMLYEESGGDLKLLENQKVGEFINTTTGRTNTPWNNNAQMNRWMNLFLFSPRWMFSRIKVITDLKYIKHYGDQDFSIDKLRARRSVNSLVFMAVMTAAAQAIRGLIWDDEDTKGAWALKWNPESSDFGKITIGGVHIDSSFGMAQYITLMSRTITGKKVGLDGVRTDRKFGDLLNSFTKSKESPILQQGLALSAIAAWGLGIGDEAKKYSGDVYGEKAWTGIQPMDVMLEWGIDFVPLGLGAQFDMMGASAMDRLVALTADSIGVSANYYGTSRKDEGKSDELLGAEKDVNWKAGNQSSIDSNPSESSNLMKGLTGERQQQARQDVRSEYNRRANNFIKSSDFDNMSPEEQTETLRGIKSDVLKKMTKKYGIKAKKAKKRPERKY